jgi:hypothetical protein
VTINPANVGIIFWSGDWSVAIDTTTGKVLTVGHHSDLTAGLLSLFGVAMAWSNELPFQSQLPSTEQDMLKMWEKAQ